MNHFKFIIELYIPGMTARARGGIVGVVVVVLVVVVVVVVEVVVEGVVIGSVASTLHAIPVPSYPAIH